MIDQREITTKSRPIRVLVVDDNPAALYATSRVLRSAGYEVLEAATGAAGLEAAPRADLVVLDINLPDMDGFEVCRRIRANPQTRQLPVLHLSATFTNAADYTQGFEAGADSYLTRPVESPVLIATVRTLLFARHADLIRRRSDARFRTVFDLAPVAIAILDDALKLESVNPAYCALTGYSAEELVGRPLETCLIDEPENARELAVARSGTHPRDSGHFTFRRKDGGLADVAWQIARESELGARILVAEDVSLRLEAERSRESLLSSERAARAEAERSNRLKEEFLATLSHELRNPLNAILGWATVLSRKQGLPESVSHGLQAIERNSRIQARMISDLLDYAGITFGKVRLVVETIDPYPVVKATIESLADAALAAGVAVQATFGEEAVRIEADAARLQQIVWNLLTNAFKFSSRGSSVEVTAGRHGDAFRLVVRDYGQGIAPEFLPRIFERFSQQDATTTRSHGGLGLGMAIVKQLSEVHGGNIRVHSSGKNLGTTFTLDIPLSHKEPEPSLSYSQSVRTLDFSGIVALVVEDDDDARELTRRILTDVGATVIEAASAEEALERITAGKPNVLISDIGMAQEDGYQLLRRLRALGYGPDTLPAIALTAFARTEDRSAALAAGFQDHIVKPLDPPALIRRVASLHRAAVRRPAGG
ncbi:MAG TPA: response regulator [Steroidobacteraceae bacterium]|nr:response regulator [Steroidobacteraceae bacterium]